MEELLQQSTEKSPTERRKLTTVGKVLIGISAGSFTVLSAVTIPFVLPAVRRYCLPFVPATTEQVKNVMCLLRKGDGKLIDLGSGDGRLVIEAAKQGYKAEGIELNPWLVGYSRLKSWREGVGKSTKFYTKDLWKADLSTYDKIVIFGVEQMMPQLETKLNQELSSSSNVIACRFPLPNWTPIKTVGEGIDTVWLYTKPKETNS